MEQSFTVGIASTETVKLDKLTKKGHMTDTCDAKPCQIKSVSTDTVSLKSSTKRGTVPHGDETDNLMCQNNSDEGKNSLQTKLGDVKSTPMEQSGK